MKIIHFTVISLIILLLNACASVEQKQCPAGTQNLPDCPPLNAVDDQKINKLYQMRTWIDESDLTIDPIKLGAQAKIPINSAATKILGPSHEDALDSLALKIWMIENAQHTVDATYYIFKPDLIGYAILGAMCNAVKRGVDVRIMVDSIGSLRPGHNELRALETCAEHAGFMRNGKGQITTRKARIQVVIFNAITKLQFNRRSHDKLLISDGFFADKALVMTGGRNISLDYYGIHADGSKDPTTFRDLEVVIKSGKNTVDEEYTVGKVSEIYYSLLFLHKGNRRIWPAEGGGEYDFSGETYSDDYIEERNKSQQSLAFVKAMPAIKKRFQNMTTFINKDFHDAKVRLSHQLSNLTSERVTTDVRANIERNPNSILYLIDKINRHEKKQGTDSGTLRIVSPYLFSGKYRNEDDEIVYDGTKEVLAWLSENPDFRLEVITNSVLTSDNAFTQAIIDMDMAPGYLLTPDFQKAWLSDLEDGEFNQDIVASDAWKKLINHPQVFIYQTGRNDSVILGGTVEYGKLHAKFIVSDKRSFIGTSNFDYRSNLYNNEMGYFIESEGLNKDLQHEFEALKKTSYRWGSPEWLQMRKKLMESDSDKAGSARRQRLIFKTIRFLGLEYLM